MDESKYLISLSIDDEESLNHLYNKLLNHGANVVAFREPDMQDQLTSICYYGTPLMRKITNKLKLSLTK
jgi:hypothetical protein